MKKSYKPDKPRITAESEKELVNLAKEGNSEAFGKIVEEYLKRVHSLAFSLSRNTFEAEEIVQEAFLKAYKNIRSFRSESGISTWLYRITVNTFLNSRRRKPDLPLESLTDYRNIYKNSISQADNDAANDLCDCIEKSLRKLSERERTVFVLRHYESIHIREIAHMLGISRGTARTLLYRAVRKLRCELSFLNNSKTINRRKNGQV